MFPSINPSVKCALRWYKNPMQRTRHTIQCKESVETCPWAMIMPRRVSTPFQILAGTGEAYGKSIPTSWKLYSLSGTMIVNLTSLIEELEVEQFASPSRDYIILDEALPFGDGIGSMSEGLYEMEIETEGGTYYSETIRFCNDTDCMYQLTWRSCGDIGTQRYAFRDFTNIMYFEQSQLSVERPLPVYKEEEEETDKKADLTVLARKDVDWSMVIKGLPWYALDAISEIPLHDTVTLRLPNESQEDVITDVVVEATWPDNDACEAQAVVKFRADESSVATGCCAAFTPPCISPCVTADGIWEEGDPTPTIENVYLLPRGYYGTYLGFDFGDPPERVDAFGFGRKELCVSRLALVGETYYRWTGSSWLEAIYFLDVSGGDCEGQVFLTGNMMPQYGALIQYTLDGSEWIDAGGPYTSDEFGSGVTVDVPVEALSIRAKLVGDDCDIATSAVIANPCNTECAFIVSLSDRTLANGEYYEAGEVNGRTSYANANGFVCEWALYGSWRFNDPSDDAGCYGDPEDVATPLDVTTWMGGDWGHDVVVSECE